MTTPKGEPRDGPLSVGAIIMPTDYGAAPQDVARVLEDHGFESLFIPEHTHIPWSRTSPFPLSGALPQPYWRNLDPFIVMGVALAATERLVLGTGVCLIAQRDPILTAKTVATLDHLSGGRVELGVGAGWNVEEMRNHGVDPDRRWRTVREHVLAMKSIWSHADATFDGDIVSFHHIASWPKPTRPGGVPILIGGNSAHTALRIGSYGDGWIPTLSSAVPDLVRRIQAVGTQLASRGKSLPPVTVAYDYRRTVQPGEIEQLEAAGASRVLLAIDAMPYDETVSAVRAHAHTVREHLRL